MQIDKLRGKELDQLCEAVLSLKDKDEAYRFFDDLCTINEIQSLAQRLEVARMLREGNTYHKIETQTGASTATISRVKRCLNYGNDTYAMVLERVHQSDDSGEDKE
ncbi:YerC/YecD family TrpR-related protein [Jeotgalibacillus haloalkalitolerans]|uniref:YerC/YecD family TrpR-related protein n=1 Tax=Jeotgalibacillus haloalkalitolerans TaxID=3104292 RepID=A0ABU5KQG3_9BACL|nr:YerC/YecD family TrpR-related protein [Jeotgalibacillus sp. HH7-29]MDZ5713495.1 YerC/YecD family TrpR-related protein [Jeotgalibacillus sp. HH7-29]